MIPFDQIQSALARLRGILCAYFDRRAAARIERRTRMVRASRAAAIEAYAKAGKGHRNAAADRAVFATTRQLKLEIGR